jgi:hypothetical protein
MLRLTAGWTGRPPTPSGGRATVFAAGRSRSRQHIRSGSASDYAAVAARVELAVDAARARLAVGTGDRAGDAVPHGESDTARASHTVDAFGREEGDSLTLKFVGHTIGRRRWRSSRRAGAAGLEPDTTAG